MIPYYLLLFIPLVFAVIYELVYEKQYKKYNYKKKNYTIVVFFIIYFLLLALRSENVGVDVPRYLDIYNEIKGMSFLELFNTYGSSDIGYYLFNKILSCVGFNDRMFLITVSIITVIPVCYMYYKETKNSLVSIALFIVLPTFQMYFSGLRQAIAISLAVPCYYYVKEKKVKKFLLTVLLAITFHRSAIILLIMYSVYYWNIKAKHFLFIAPIGGIFYLFNSQIYIFALRLMGGRFAERYAVLSQTGAYTLLFVFIMFTIYAYFFVDEKKIKFEEKRNRNFLIVMVLLQMFAPINSVAMRLNYYFILFIPFIIPQMTTRLMFKDNRIKILIFTIIYIVFMYYYLDKSHSIDSLNIYPYEWFISNL